MAFDFQRALSLGRQAARLVDSLRGDGDAAPSPGARRPSSTAGGDGLVFDPGLPPREDRLFDPTSAPDCWPAPAPRGTAGRPGRGASAATGGPLPDFTGTAAVEYAPVPGPTAGPGEVVWTWVPYEEMDGRGKDRPVLIVGRDGAHLLGVMLTSRDHTNALRRDEDYVDVGTGPWDRTGRASETKLDRVLRVDPAAVRRERGVLDPARFAAVGEALAREQGWAR